MPLGCLIDGFGFGPIMPNDVESGCLFLEAILRLFFLIYLYFHTELLSIKRKHAYFKLRTLLLPLNHLLIQVGEN